MFSQLFQIIPCIVGTVRFFFVLANRNENNDHWGFWLRHTIPLNITKLYAFGIPKQWARHDIVLSR